jgi:hypothetical protein
VGQQNAGLSAMFRTTFILLFTLQACKDRTDYVVSVCLSASSTRACIFVTHLYSCNPLRPEIYLNNIMTSYGLVDGYKHFGGIYDLNFQGGFDVNQTELQL